MKPNADIYLSVAVVESDGYLYLRCDADDTPARKELRSDEYRAYAHGRVIHGQRSIEVTR